jgi:hypothetical protein
MEGKGKVKEITSISAVSIRFETVSKYRNKPKEVIIFFRKKYRNRTETVIVSVCFGSNRKKKNPFHRTPYFPMNPLKSNLGSGAAGVFSRRKHGWQPWTVLMDPMRTTHRHA